MKRPSSTVSSDKHLKRKKLDHSSNEKTSPKKLQVSSKTAFTPRLDPLFAGIAKKILGTNVSNHLPKKATPTKQSAPVTVKRENVAGSSFVEHKKTKKVRASSLKQVAADSDSSTDSSSGIESLSSTKKNTAVKPNIKLELATTKSVVHQDSTSSDSSSSSDDEPISFIVSKPLVKTSKGLRQSVAQQPVKMKGNSSSSEKPIPKEVPKTVIPRRDSSSDSSLSSDGGYPPVKPIPRKVPKEAVPEDSDSSSSSDSESPPVKSIAKAAVPKKITSKDSGSPSSSANKKPPVTPTTKKVISQKTVSEESDSTSSVDSDPPPVKPLARKVIPKKVVSEESDSSSSSDSEPVPVKPFTNKEVVPKKMVSGESYSVKPIPNKLVPKKTVSEDSERLKGKSVREALNSCSQADTAKKNHSTTLTLLGGAEIRKQPPISVRKKNIIDMELSFYDVKMKPVSIEKACFVAFVDEDGEPSCAKRNGIHYKIAASFSDGTKSLQDIYLRVVDGRDDELVCYEGNDIAEDLRRVLLTHEVSCARCRSNLTCGTRAQTPGNPVIIGGKILKFYVRCNTTCAVKRGGRIGQSNNRTFKLVFSTSPYPTEETILALSTQFNVHHNTKMKRLLSDGFNPISRKWGEPLPVHNE